MDRFAAVEVNAGVKIDAKVNVRRVAKGHECAARINAVDVGFRGPVIVDDKALE